MRRRIAIVLCLMLTASVMCTMLTSCDDGPAVGFWTMDEISGDGILMTQEDAESLGQSAVGTIKLQKSGVCKVEKLGYEYDGEWTLAEDGTLTITCGDDLELTGTIDDEGIMTLTDPQGFKYKLSK